MNGFVVTLFHRTTPDDGKLDAPERYVLIDSFSIETLDPKKAVESAAAQSDSKMSDGRRRTKTGDIAVAGGIAYECRLLGWIEHSDANFAGSLGIDAIGLNGRLARAVGSLKIHWERAKIDLRLR
jgi:hypothetical protein